jgi:hypothetical protein
MAHLNGGWEDSRLGTSGWLAGAGYLRWRLAPRLSLSARADAFREWQAEGATGRAAPIFWGGAAWVASQTVTADLRPSPNLSLRLELRRDAAAAPLYFDGEVARDADGRDLPDSRRQWTLTAGAVTWF